MSDDHLLIQIENNVATLTLNRPDRRNALSAQAIGLFFTYLDQAQNDDSVRAVCITGAGDRAFCAGADLGGGMAGSGEALDPFLDYARLIKRIAGFPKPVVAKVNGSCVAGGTGLMLACDIVIATDKAKFGTPEVNVGLFPMMIGALIYRNVPRKKAMEMVLLGDKLTSAQALDMGLVTRIVPGEKLDEETRNILGTLIKKSPVGMKLGKEAFHTMQDMPFSEALDYLAGKLMEVAGTEDAVEGITAFIQKREPDFKGK